MDVDELRRLMTMYQRGSLEAFEQVYGALAPSLRAYLTALTRDVAQADDLVQESFLQIHRSRHTYRPDLPATALGIRDRATRLDDGSARRGRDGRQFRVSCRSCRCPQKWRVLPTVMLCDARSGSLLDDRREALLLHHVWGFSFAEIGQMLGIRADAAKLRSSRGMNDLRAILRPETRDA